MVPDDHDEVDMNDYDPDNDRQQHRWEDINLETTTFFIHEFFRRGHGGGYDDDDEEGHGHHGPGVQCASQ